MIKINKKKFKYKNNRKKGIFHIYSTFNNTIITLTSLMGNTISWSSAGSLGFKGTRKSTPYGAQLAAENIISKASDLGIKIVKILVKGQGSGRDAALSTIIKKKKFKFKISSIQDITKIPHNGCRPPKKRRI